MDPLSTEPPTVLPRPDHPISRKLIDPDALWVMRKLRKEGFLAYLVGGAVRDMLLDIEPKDYDLATDARPSQVRALFRNCRLIGRRFRLAHIYFRRKGQPEKIIEVSTFRSMNKWEEGEEAPPDDLDQSGHLFGTPEEDAQRRDFTVNGLFYNIDDFSVIDHVGGLVDLERRAIRLIGEPDERYAEDPVRMLRAIEFAARLGFQLEERTEQGIVDNAGRIGESSPARIREELRQLQARGIMAPVLGEADRLGLLHHLFPELVTTDGMLPLVALFDSAVHNGNRCGEPEYLAAMILPSVAAECPLQPGTLLEDAQKSIGPLVDTLTRRYQISAHIRHLAKDLLLACYRLVRGKSYRSKGKFARKPEFKDAWTLFGAWAAHSGDLDEMVAYWQQYLGGGETRPTQSRRRRRRRGPRRRGGAAAGGGAPAAS